MAIERKELYRHSVEDDKGQKLHSRLWARQIQGPKGAFTTKEVEVFGVVAFTRKDDSRDGTKKAGEQDYFKFHEISLKRLADYVALLWDIDQQYNEGKAFARYSVKSGPRQLPLADDDIPF